MILINLREEFKYYQNKRKWIMAIAIILIFISYSKTIIHSFATNLILSVFFKNGTSEVSFFDTQKDIWLNLYEWGSHDSNIIQRYIFLDALRKGDDSLNLAYIDDNMPYLLERNDPLQIEAGILLWNYGYYKESEEILVTAVRKKCHLLKLISYTLYHPDSHLKFITTDDLDELFSNVTDFAIRNPEMCSEDIFIEGARAWLHGIRSPEKAHEWLIAGKIHYSDSAALEYYDIVSTLALKDYPLAIKLLNKIAIKPHYKEWMNDEEIHLQLGSIYMENPCLYNLAIKEFELAIVHATNPVYAYLRLAQVYEKSGQTDKAIDILSKIITMEADNRVNQNDVRKYLLSLIENRKQ